MNSQVFGPISRSNQGLLGVFSTVSGAWASRKALLQTCSAHAYHRSGRVYYHRTAQCFAQIPGMISYKTANSFYFLTFSASSMDQKSKISMEHCDQSATLAVVPMTIRPCLISQAAVVWQRSTSWLSAEDVNLAHLWFGGVWKWLHPPNRHFNGEYHLPNHRIYVFFSRIFRKFSVGQTVLWSIWIWLHPMRPERAPFRPSAQVARRVALTRAATLSMIQCPCTPGLRGSHWTYWCQT